MGTVQKEKKKKKKKERKKIIEESEMINGKRKVMLEVK